LNLFAVFRENGNQRKCLIPTTFMILTPSK
jgi:hypothetical protein